VNKLTLNKLYSIYVCKYDLTIMWKVWRPTKNSFEAHQRSAAHRMRNTALGHSLLNPKSYNQSNFLNYRGISKMKILSTAATSNRILFLFLVTIVANHCCHFMFLDYNMDKKIQQICFSYRLICFIVST